MTKYILVQWPDSQLLCNHPRFKECLFVCDVAGHDQVGSSAYMCPEEVYREIYEDVEPISKSDRALKEAVVYKHYEELQEIMNDLASRCSGGEQTTLNFLNGKIEITVK